MDQDFLLNLYLPDIVPLLFSESLYIILEQTSLLSINLYHFQSPASGFSTLVLVSSLKKSSLEDKAVSKSSFYLIFLITKEVFSCSCCLREGMFLNFTLAFQFSLTKG
jgi:hypothetical protein